jgi:hypothetical protein
MTTKVYLVGDANSPKTNQWLSMTNCPTLAVERALEVGPEATRKVVTVAPPRYKR